VEKGAADAKAFAASATSRRHHGDHLLSNGSAEQVMLTEVDSSEDSTPI